MHDKNSYGCMLRIKGFDTEYKTFMKRKLRCLTLEYNILNTVHNKNKTLLDEYQLLTKVLNDL